MNLANIKLLKKIKILYVEDEIGIQTVTAEAFSNIFHTVTSASDGVEALEYFNGDIDYDIIVTDINMPRMNGIELIKKVRDIDALLPITITTAHTEIEFLRDAINLNVNGYTFKPINMVTLINTIAQAAEARILKKELEEINNGLVYQLKEKTFELNSILNAQDSLVVVSSDEVLHSANKAFLDFLDKDSIEQCNNDIENIFSIFQKEEGYFYADDFSKIDDITRISQNKDKDIFVKIKSKNNSFNIFKLSITTYEFNGMHYVITLTNITKLKEQSNLLEYQATHDSLTKLANRQKFNSDFTTELNRFSRYGNNLTLVMFDIDFFKSINDAYGHDIGDVVLVNLSSLVNNMIRETDLLARWGGEEFMILLPETSIEKSFDFVEKVRLSIQNAVLSEVLKSPITCSFGITQAKENDTQDTILKRIDLALYEAKNSGRNKTIKK